MDSRPTRADELCALFVSVTGDDAVTERQRPNQSNRELPRNTTVDVDDGLADAVAGADVEDVSDPAS